MILSHWRACAPEVDKTHLHTGHAINPALHPLDVRLVGAGAWAAAAGLQLARVVLPSRGFHFAVIANFGGPEYVQARRMDRIQKPYQIRARQSRRQWRDQRLVSGGFAVSGVFFETEKNVTEVVAPLAAKVGAVSVVPVAAPAPSEPATDVTPL